MVLLDSKIAAPQRSWVILSWTSEKPWSDMIFRLSKRLRGSWTIKLAVLVVLVLYIYSGPQLPQWSLSLRQPHFRMVVSNTALNVKKERWMAIIVARILLLLVRYFLCLFSQSCSQEMSDNIRLLRYVVLCIMSQSHL